MNDRFLSFSGLCKKAGKISVGLNMSSDAARKASPGLLVISSDASENTKRSALKICKDSGTKSIIKYTQSELGRSIGEKDTAVIAVFDPNMSKKLISLYEADKGE